MLFGEDITKCKQGDNFWKEKLHHTEKYRKIARMYIMQFESDDSDGEPIDEERSRDREVAEPHVEVLADGDTITDIDDW